MMNYPVVTEVIKDSIADRVGLSVGDEIIEINGERIKDILDYRFYSADPEMVIEIKRNGEELLFTAENECGEELGLVLSYGDEGRTKHCKNKCIFCFIDQMPGGMRDTLYIKDDDVRLSFLTGSYITLTNLTENDVARIIYQHISPVNVSVHTVNPKLRVQMLKNKDAGKVYKIMKQLKKGGITMNCQVVLVKGVNDGKELDLTIKKLLRLYPYVNSLSVVPVGLTKYRHGLTELSLFNGSECGEVIDQIEAWQKKAQKKHGVSFVYASDEFYLNAKREFPDEESYDGYPQIENGVGMITSLRGEIARALSDMPEKVEERHVGMVTGVAAEELMREISEKISEKYKNVTAEIFAVKNDFFGETVTVTGLVCGKDVLAQLSGKKLPEVLLMPEVMFKAETDLMLDDVTVKDIEKALNVKVQKVKTDGASTVSAILGI